MTNPLVDRRNIALHAQSQEYEVGQAVDGADRHANQDVRRLKRHPADRRGRSRHRLAEDPRGIVAAGSDVQEPQLDDLPFLHFPFNIELQAEAPYFEPAIR